MKYKITSDLHLDFYLSKPTITKAQARNFIKTRKLGDYFAPETSEPTSLIVAGDIGHYPEQNLAFLLTIKELYGYTDIIVVAGNHEFYNISKSQRGKFTRFYDKEQYQTKLLRDSGIIVLDGDIVEHYGKVIAGYPAWYDGTGSSRGYGGGYGTGDVIALWRATMNDSNLIPEMDKLDFYDIVKYQNAKLGSMRESMRESMRARKVDIFVTHVSPNVGIDYVPWDFRGSGTNCFYWFNGDELLEEFQPEIWVYGHTHKRMHYMKDGTEFFCNPLGYPAEIRGKNVVGVEI